MSAGASRRLKGISAEPLRAWAFLAVGSVLICGGGHPARADTSTLEQQVAALVQPQLDQFPDASLGVAVGVVTPDASGAMTTNTFYFGTLADESGKPIPLTRKTRFEIGSVTKTFTTTILAALIQVNPQLLNLSINTIFPDAPTFQAQPATLGDLADYTSGFPDTNRDGGSASCIFGGGTIEVCYDLPLLFENLRDPSLSGMQFAPGTGYVYSDLAVALLGLAEPALLGVPVGNPSELLKGWEALVRWIVLEPLQMKRTHTFDPAADPARLPQGFTLDAAGNAVQAKANHDLSWPAFIPAGGLVSTPEDMMTYLMWSLGLLNSPLNALLPVLHAPATTVTTGTSSDDRLGIGWFIGTVPGSSIGLISKDGDVPGFTAQIDFAPSTNTGVFVLTNTNGIVDAKQIASKLMQAINGLTPTDSGPSADQP